jgi:hypothetical protein
LRAVLEALARDGLKSVVMAGSVFEQNEGAGEWSLRLSVVERSDG